MAHIRGGLLGLYTQRRWVLRHAQKRFLYTRPPPPNDLVHLQAKWDKPHSAGPCAAAARALAPVGGSAAPPPGTPPPLSKRF